MVDIPNERIFNGKKYTVDGFYSKKKSDANRKADNLRKNGYMVRTVKYGDKYVNYATYSKKRIKEANVERKKHGMPKYKRPIYKRSPKGYKRNLKGYKRNPFPHKKK